MIVTVGLSTIFGIAGLAAQSQYGILKLEAAVMYSSLIDAGY
jgi:hypothetical protein